MTKPVLLDISRSVWRRLAGQTPSGIDRVCDAYAARLSGEALAVLQFRGRFLVLDRDASDRLFTAMNAPTAAFRRKFMRILAKLPWSIADKPELNGALYLNLSHSDFDRDAHWRAIDRLGVRPVYLMHDLIPITHPHVTTPRKTARHRRRVSKALTNAAGIIANSHTTAAELRAFAACEALPLPPLLIAPIAGESLPVPLHVTQHDTPFFVSVGTIEARKNHRLLLDVWSLLVERLGDKAPRLVLAGNWGLQSHQFRSQLRSHARLQNFVEIQTGLSDPELAALVASAHGVLLPSLAEGYGLPMVEALQMKVPVIASDLPSFHEVGQGIPTLLDPGNAADWAEAIIDFCENGPEWQRQTGAMGSFQPSTWDAHFAALDEWLANLCVLPDSAHADHENRDHNAPMVATAQDRKAQC